MTRQLPSLIASVLLVACPHAPSGRWLLAGVDGRPVPAGVATVPGDTLMIYEGYLEFRGGDSILRGESTVGWRQADSGIVQRWRFTLRGDSLMVFYDCPPMRICPGEEPGILTRDSIVLRSSRFGGVRLIYRREQ